MTVTFYIDPETGLPHIYDHGVTEGEVRQVLARRGVDEWGADESRIKYGQTAAGRYLKVIYRMRPEPTDVFVITAYEIRGKNLKAFRRRQRRK